VTVDLYYDPYDIDIDADPYPTYKRLRDEAPLYYNERLDFWGLRASPRSVEDSTMRSSHGREAQEVRR
jgi:hypothetical protein